MLIITSDRGFAGSYNVNVLRRTEELLGLLRNEGKEPVLYVVGRKGETYYRFRDREFAESWTGFSEQPRYEDAQEVGRTLIEAFTAGEDDEDGGAGADGILGVDELHIVYTEFRSLLSQVPVAKRMAPLVVEEVDEFSDERDQPERTSEGSRRSTSSSRRLSCCWTRCCPSMSRPASTRRCSMQRPASRRPGAGVKSASDNAKEIVKNLAGRPTRPARRRSPRKSPRSRRRRAWSRRLRRLT